VGSGSSPSPVQFSSHCHFHKLSCSWLLSGAAVPAGRHVCLQLTWEVGLPSSPVEFSSLCHSHKLSHSWLLGAWPALAGASPAHRACLFTVLGRIPFLQSLALCVPHPLSHVSLLFLLLTSQFLFSLGLGQSVQGAMLLWPRVVCGSTTVLWSSPCPHFPKLSGQGQLAARGPPCFSV
jgi:hypothetical protein